MCFHILFVVVVSHGVYGTHLLGWFLCFPLRGGAVFFAPCICLCVMFFYFILVITVIHINVHGVMGDGVNVICVLIVPTFFCIFSHCACCVYCVHHWVRIFIVQVVHRSLLGLLLFFFARGYRVVPLAFPLGLSHVLLLLYSLIHSVSNILLPT